MLETVVVGEERLVMMHMMCCTTVFDPNAFYFSNMTVDCRFAAVCETTEYRIVGGGAAISICICISQICCLWIISTPTASTTSPLSQPPPLLLLLFWDAFRACLALYSSVIRLCQSFSEWLRYSLWQYGGKAFYGALLTFFDGKRR